MTIVGSRSFRYITCKKCRSDQIHVMDAGVADALRGRKLRRRRAQKPLRDIVICDNCGESWLTRRAHMARLSR